MTIVIFLCSSVESCEGGHGISAREEEVCASSLHTERSIAMANFLLPSLESGGGGHVISSREEEVCPPSPKKERVIALVTFLSSSVESCEGDHGLCHHLLEKRGGTLLFQGRRG